LLKSHLQPTRRVSWTKQPRSAATCLPGGSRLG